MYTLHRVVFGVIMFRPGQFLAYNSSGYLNALIVLFTNPNLFASFLSLVIHEIDYILIASFIIFPPTCNRTLSGKMVCFWRDVRD